MAYVGVSGQFDSGLTNPSRQTGGAKPWLGMNAGVNPNMGSMAGTKPLTMTPPAVGGGSPGIAASGSSAPAQGTDQYWPWPTAAPATPSDSTPNSIENGRYPSVISTGAGKSAHFPWQNQLADYGAAPPMPEFSPGAGPVSGAPAGQYAAYNPTMWNEPDIGIPEAGVNTRDVVNSLKPQLEEEMAASMGNAGRRFGALGGLKGTGYATTLGNSERKMFSDLNALNYKYDYDAAQADANRKSQAREGTLGRAYGAWGTTEGLRAGEAGRRTGYNVGQQDRADALSQSNAARADAEAARKGGFDWEKYGAGLSEAQRKQMYDQLKLQYGG